MMQLSAHTRLGKKPRQIDTRTGKTMAVAPAAVNVAIAQSEDTETIWLDLVAFGRTAEELLRHKQGDLLNVMGNVAVRRWTDQNGETRSNWQVVVEALLSARTTRPKSGNSPRHREAEYHTHQQTQQFQQPTEPGDFNDPMPF